MGGGVCGLRLHHLKVCWEGVAQLTWLAGRSGQTFGKGAPGNDTKEGGAVNEDNVKDNVSLAFQSTCLCIYFRATHSHGILLAC
jgi:hypothetical protein